jgi:NAD(P)-dependent dehydrogenase (short-subunit alcohol dehydrogenase family)
MYPYRASKSALNSITKAMSYDLKPRGITVVAMHPGWVRTEMGGPSADIDTDTSVTGMKKVVDNLQPSDSGRFMVYDGTELPW